MKGDCLDTAPRADRDRHLMQTHETVSSFRRVVIGSDRKFGAVFGLVFSVLGIWPVVHHHSPRWWLITIAGLFFAAALLFPRSLAPLNRAWFKLGLVLNRIVSPIVTGGLFFGALVPIVSQEGYGPAEPQARPERDDLLDRGQSSRSRTQQSDKTVLRIKRCRL